MTTTIPTTQPSRNPVPVAVASGESNMRITAMIGIGLIAIPTASGSRSPITAPMAAPRLEDLPAASRSGSPPAEELDGYQTSPSRQSQVSGAVRSSGMLTGRTCTVPSSSAVRRMPSGVSAKVGPVHGSQPRAV